MELTFQCREQIANKPAEKWVLLWIKKESERRRSGILGRIGKNRLTEKGAFEKRPEGGEGSDGRGLQAEGTTGGKP